MNILESLQIIPPARRRAEMRRTRHWRKMAATWPRRRAGRYGRPAAWQRANSVGGTASLRRRHRPWSGRQGPPPSRAVRRPALRRSTAVSALSRPGAECHQNATGARLTDGPTTVTRQRDGAEPSRAHCPTTHRPTFNWTTGRPARWSTVVRRWSLAIAARQADATRAAVATGRDGGWTASCSDVTLMTATAPSQLTSGPLQRLPARRE